jgi:hypothetical protein
MDVPPRQVHRPSGPRLQPYLIKTSDGWYVHELRGVVYVTWVCGANREHALVFHCDQPAIENWCVLIHDMTGLPTIWERAE